LKNLCGEEGREALAARVEILEKMVTLADSIRVHKRKLSAIAANRELFDLSFEDPESG
jgi:hypothetical protein